jgi:hypothetical protein
MKKTLLSAAIACSALFGFAAQASTVSIDDFNSGDQSITVGAVGTVVSDTNAIRTLTTQLLNTAPPTQSAVEVSYGGLHVTNGGGEDSQVTVSWTLPATRLPAGATNVGFLFTVLASDANATDIQFFLNGTSLSNFSIPGNTANQDLTFGIANGALDAGGTLKMVLNGAVGWDLDLDSIGLSYDLPAGSTVPEPASIALLGLGLAGVAATRRRKS